MAAKQFHQPELRFVELPIRREVASLLVAIRISHHDFLYVVAVRQKLTVKRQAHELVHDASAFAQAGDGLKQRYDVHTELGLRSRTHEARFFEQQGRLKNITRVRAGGDDVCGQRVATVTPLKLSGSGE